MSEQPAVRVWEAAAAASWAILPERLPAIFEIAAREHGADLEAVAARLGRPLDNARAATVRDGVMVIPIEGVIFPRASLFTAISGGVSTNDIALDLHAALDDATVHSVALVVDSPGGDINGVAELAAMVRAATAKKRVTAYVRALGASAAYWIIAAADEIVAAPTAMLGSIGIVQTVGDGGRRVGGTVDFVSSQSPHKNVSPTTGGGVARIQARIDAIAEVFIGDIARYRGITREQVVERFGGGDILVGQQAVDAGLADRLGSFEGVVADLQQRAREPRRIGGGGRMAAQGTEGPMADQTRFERFMAWLTGEGDDSAFAAANIAASGPTTAPMPTPSPQPVAAGIPDGSADELARLRAENARLIEAQATRQRDGIAGAAAAFAESEIRAGRALPAEQAALVAAYTDAATDDLDHPRAEGATTRVAALVERQRARPAHALTRELVPVRPEGDGSLTVLGNAPTTRREGDAPALTAERWREQRTHNPAGLAFLALNDIPRSGPLTAEHRATIARLAAMQHLAIAAE